MARSTKTASKVLLSLIAGEQREIPVDLSFYPDASQLISTAVFIEGTNKPGQVEPPSEPKIYGVKTPLLIRYPTSRGIYNPDEYYSRGDMVLYNGQYYELTTGYNCKNCLTSPLWRKIGLNRLYVCIPYDIAMDWSQEPTLETSTYGFIELTCKELPVVAFPLVWKPIVGLVEIKYSPTRGAVHVG